MTPRWYQLWTRNPGFPPPLDWSFAGWHFGTFDEVNRLKDWISCEGQQGQTFVVTHQDGSPIFEKRC